jgi:adenosine deaminase
MGQSLSVFDTLVAALQTDSSLSEAAECTLNHLWDQRVAWAELRFCPGLHTDRGLSSQDAIRAVLSGVAKSRMPYSAVIVCALRSKGPEHALDMAADAVAAGAHGFDVAGNEQSYPSLEAVAGDAIRMAKASGLGVTAHAGEWPGTGSGVREALALGVDRIGHGIAIGGSSELLDMVKAASTVIECCPTANVGSLRVKEYGSHPIREMLQRGVLATVSCDNLLASGNAATGPPTPSGELVRLLTSEADGGVGLTEEQVVTAICNGTRRAFGTDTMHRQAAASLLERAAESGLGVSLKADAAAPGRECLTQAVQAVARAELAEWTRSAK